MQLEYETVEDAFDDTTHIRTMTEQARLGDGSLLLRTTAYTPHHMSVHVAYLPAQAMGGGTFDPVAP